MRFFKVGIITLGGEMKNADYRLVKFSGIPFGIKNEGFKGFKFYSSKSAENSASKRSLLFPTFLLFANSN